VSICQQLWRRDWDSRRNQTRASPHRRGDSIEGDIWTGHVDRLGAEVVQQICGSVEPFYQAASQNRSLKEQGVHHIINGAKNMLGFTVL
jgi:hypothetical protein